MPTVKEIEAFMNTLAPQSLAEKWDNVGLLVHCAGEVTGVLCALDITPQVIQEAIANACNVIVSHHPVVFEPMKTLDADEPAAMLLQNNISAICMHTNLDAAAGGVSDALAQTLELTPSALFSGCGRIVYTDTTVAQLAQKASVLGGKTAYYDAGRPIKTLAIVGGAGGDFVKDAAALGADCLFTGEVHYHDALDAQRMGISFIAAGHYETEQPIVAVLCEKISAAFENLRVLASARTASPYTYY